MEPVVSLRDAGVRFRVKRRGRRGRGVPQLFARRRESFWGIRNLSLDVQAGELVGIIGPNGSGKTTLLRTIAGIYAVDEGTATVRGRAGPMLSMSAGLEPALNGWENAELSSVLLGATRAEARARVASIGEFAELGRFLEAPVRVYSAGMKARLGLGILLLSEPDVVVLDEVISVVDQEFRERTDEHIRGLVEAGKTVVIASHEVETLAAVATRMVRLGGGRVVEEGDPKRVAERFLAEQDQAAHEERRPLRKW